MNKLIVILLLLASRVVHAQTITNDTPAPGPVSDTRGDDVIWEEEYIPPTPTAPPDGPTKLGGDRGQTLTIDRKENEK